MATTDAAPASLATACKHWQNLDLDGMRQTLDDTGLKIAEHQEEAIANRKKLAESTREFKKNAGDDVGKGWGSLLKMYQAEIDRLTKRCKHSETAFLELYQKLYEAPDPAHALAVALETASRVADLEAQNRKLSSELADYKAESAAIKNQDLTIRRLEEKVRNLEAALEEREQEIEEAKQQAVAEADAARVQQMQDREEQLTAMLAEAQASLETMRKLHTATQNQLFAIQSQTEDDEMSKQTELDLASVELERAQERLLALEREKQQLQKQLTGGTPRAAASGQFQEGAHEATSAGATQQALPGQLSYRGGVDIVSGAVEETLRQELYTQREMATRLRLEVASLRRELEEGTEMWEARLEGLRSSLAASESQVLALEQQLAARPTNQQVEDLKSQIRLLQAVGYNTVEDDEDDEAAASGSTGGGAEASQGSQGKLAAGSMEAMLLQKNRHLEHELTMARLKIVDTRSQLDAANSSVSELQSQLADKAALVARLEEDLMESRKAWTAGAGRAQQAGKGKSGTHLGGLLGSDADLSQSGGAAGGVEEEDGQSSMVRVVCGQRDRLRARVMEVEEELAKAKTELATAKNQLAAAQADNVALVERLRYVNSYKAQQGKSGKLAVDVEVGADVERRYGRIYEDGINPFKKFQGEQQERQKTQLHFADKFMYMFGQLVFGSTGARFGTFIYLVCLHLLVALTLTRMSHHSSGAIYEQHQRFLDHDVRHNVMTAMHEGAAVVAQAVASPILASKPV